MSGTVTIRKQNQFLELTLDGGPLPRPLAQRLEAATTHQTTEFLRGFAAKNAEGNYQPIRTRVERHHWYERGGSFACPRGYIAKVVRLCAADGYGSQLVDLNPPSPRPQAFDVRFDRIFERMSLRYRQDEMVAAVVAACTSYSECGLILAAAGYGKSTSLAAFALGLPQAKILVTTKSLDVLGRIRDTLAHYVPAVGHVGGGKRRFERVTVCSADSLHLVPHDPDEEPDILFGDEIHELCGESYLAELSKFKRTRMFGLTATYNMRADKRDLLLESIFGEPIFEMGTAEAEAQGLILPVRYRFVPVVMAFNPCEDMRETAKKRNGIWRNQERNQLVAREALSFDPEDQVLVLVESVEHAVYLRQLMPGFTLNYDACEDYDWYVSKGMLDPAECPPMTPARRREQRRAFEAGELKKVISTVWDTGVDFTRLSVIVRACARGSDILDTQAPSRAVRRHDQSGKRYGLVVDFGDEFDPGFERKANQRRRNYERNGWQKLDDADGVRFVNAGAAGVAT